MDLQRKFKQLASLLKKTILPTFYYWLNYGLHTSQTMTVYLQLQLYKVPSMISANTKLIQTHLQHTQHYGDNKNNFVYSRHSHIYWMKKKKKKSCSNLA